MVNQEARGFVEVECGSDWKLENLLAQTFRCPTTADAVCSLCLAFGALQALAVADCFLPGSL